MGQPDRPRGRAARPLLRRCGERRGLRRTAVGGTLALTSTQALWRPKHGWGAVKERCCLDRPAAPCSPPALGAALLPNQYAAPPPVQYDNNGKDLEACKPLIDHFRVRVWCCCRAVCRLAGPGWHA